MADVTPLSFSELNRRLTSLPNYDSQSPKADRRATLGLALAGVALALYMLASRLSMPKLVELAVLGSLVCLEFVGIAINTWYTRHQFSSMRSPMKNFALELDHDLPHYHGILDWLQAQPLNDLERHAQMTRFRRERFTQKLPLLAGGVTTLGLIPVILALYLQAKEFVAGRHLTWLDFIAGLLLLLMYGLSWLSALMKSRLEAMDMYLQDALTMKQAVLVAAESELALGTQSAGPTKAFPETTTR